MDDTDIGDDELDTDSGTAGSKLRALKRSGAKSVVRMTFAKNLHQRMMARGWTQSDLARHSNQKRNNISTYIRGIALPSRQSLRALANAFGCSEDDLLPGYSPTPVEQDQPVFDMRVVSDDMATAHLRINQMVSVETATKIAQLLNEDKRPTPKQGASGDRIADRTGSS